MDDLRAELLAAFETELADHLSAMRAALADAEAARPIDLRDASRRAHSLKGAARAVEQPDTEDLAHRAEAILLSVEQGERPLDAAAVAELRGLLDAIEDSAKPGRDGDALAEAPAASSDDRIRVSGSHVERLGQSLHELRNLIQEQAAIGGNLAGLEAELNQVAAAAAREGSADLARGFDRAMRSLERLRRENARLQSQFDRNLAALEQSAERIMLVPVATLFEGYERMVREIASSQSKGAALLVEPIDAEADRRVLQALREPLLHILRNAVGHGIEDRAARLRSGKPEQGRILVQSRAESGRLRIAVADDGAGLDYRQIEARARQSGLIAPDSPAPDRDGLHALLLQQGFSTAAKVDAISGRGIGLSVVAEAVRRLHGSVSIGPSALGGTELILTVPLALSRQTLLLVEAAGASYAIPAASVRRVLRLAPDAIERIEGREVLAVESEPVPVASLAEIVGGTAAPPEGRYLLGLLLDTGAHRLVLVVDALREVRSAVLGDPTAIAADVPLVYGTALVAGELVLVLSPERIAAQASRSSGLQGLSQAAPEAADRRRTILVVDDSITTRTLEKSILEAQGYAVLVSVDGLAALERLRSGLDPVDLIVADVEMPRMDGFALLTAIRNDPALKAIPVVMMTSRNSPEDIERGLELGADAYVTKQEFDQGALISVVRQLI